MENDINNYQRKKTCPIKRRPHKTYKYADYDMEKVLKLALKLKQENKNYKEFIFENY